MRVRTLGLALLVAAMHLLSPVAEAGDVTPSAGDAARPETLSPPRSARPPADVPLSHWAYPLLERLAARGILQVDLTTRPLSRAAVVRALLNAPGGHGERGEGAPGLTDREAWALDCLRAEFLGDAIDTPTFVGRDGSASIGIGIMAGTSIGYAEDSDGDGRLEVGGPPSQEWVVRSGPADDRFSAQVDVSYELWGGVRDLIGFYSEADVILGGQEGTRTPRVSGRAREWRGVLATAERAYVKLERPRFSASFGRRGPAWGRAKWGRLLISGSAPTFDQIDAQFAVGPLAFHALHAFLEYDELGTEEDLDEGERVFLAAHRMVLSGRRGSVGLSEAVVYSSATPDPVYVNPLAPYYLSQHNERADDNILWLLDFSYRPIRGLEAYGEFLVDDVMYERYVEHPDKYGFTVGQVYCGQISRMDFELTVEYSHVRKWTYTHRRVEHRLEHDGLPVGFDLGPDADRFALEFVCHPSNEWSVGLGYKHARLGEGSLSEPFEPGEDYEPTFPSGSVVRVNGLSIELLFENLEGRTGGLGAAYDSMGGEDGDAWRAWAGIGFRI